MPADLPALARLVVGGVSIGLVLVSSACWSSPPSACHEQMVSRHGCCPLCDADCRAAISAECAAEQHEAEDPPDMPENETDGSSSEEPQDLR